MSDYDFWLWVWYVRFVYAICLVMLVWFFVEMWRYVKGGTWM